MPDPDVPAPPAADELLPGRCTFVRADGGRCAAFRARSSARSWCWGHERGVGSRLKRPAPTPTALIGRVLHAYGRELRALKSDESTLANTRRTEIMEQLITLETNRNKLVIEAVKVRKFLTDQAEFAAIAAAMAGTGEA